MSRSASLTASVLIGLVVLVAGAAGSLGAQDRRQPGRVVGRILDAATGTGLSDAGVQLVGTTTGAVSGLDGRFVLMPVAPGTVTIQVRRIGFRPKTITGLMVREGEVLEQNITLEEAHLVLQSQMVTAAAERGSVNAALDRQRTATGIISSVTQEQIARSPDSDAAQAAQRVSGVTIQDGKYIYVRGLGERYTTASLNGARIPSPEPEKKIVPLDLFPVGLLQSITTIKTFTPDQSGDFSGASVDIQTREFPITRQVTYSSSIAANSAATGHRVYSAPLVGMEWLGMSTSRRPLPAGVATVAEDRYATSADYNRAVSAFRPAWSPIRRAGSPSSSVGASIGGTDPVLGHSIGYLASLSYSYSQEVRADERRAQVEPIGTAGTAPVNVFRGSTGRTSVLWGGLLNVSTLVGSRSRIALNNTFSRTADNEARQDAGLFEACDCRMQRMLLRYVERSVRSTQLLGEHQVGDDHRIDWSGTHSSVRRDEPDRADMVYGQESGDPAGPYRWLSGDPDGAKRTYGSLTEQNATLGINYRLAVGRIGSGSFLKFGASHRATSRDADNTSYSITAAGLTDEERALNPSAIFDGRFFEATDSIFRVTPLNSGGSYEASESVSAGYSMVEYGATDRIRLIAGARVEHADLRVRSFLRQHQPNVAGKMNTDILPSLAVSYQLSDRQGLRLSASQTLSRPEYREITPIVFRDAIGEDVYFGDTTLSRTLIQNYDARWEWYPAPGELVSVAWFAKRFTDPIERIEVASSGTSQFSWANAERAQNYGLELELRKSLAVVHRALAPITLFTNATVMRSEIRTGNVVNSASRRTRAMVGQAPYVLNAGATYASLDERLSVTALYNRVGKRIHTVGASPKPDVFEQPRDVVDISLRFPVAGRLSGRADARNLLDAPFVLRQGTVDREYYRAGRVLSAGLSWRQ